MLIFWIIICAALVIGFAVYGVACDGIGFGLLSGLLGFFIGFLVAFCGSMIVGCVMSTDANTEYMLENSQALVALKDNNTISGRFFLGSGSINSTQYYYYAAENERGIKVDKVATSKCYIQYANSDYRIEWYEPVFKDKWRNWFAVQMKDQYCIVYIPDGSITEEFSVDLE